METFLGDLGTVGYWVGSTIGAVVGLVVLVLMAWLIATAVRRVLGVPVGWFRTVLVALLMLLSTNVVFDAVITQVAGADTSGALAAASAPAAMVLIIIALLWIFGLGTALLMIL